MTSAHAFARENGWTQLLLRSARGLGRRLRDRQTARLLGAPGFRAGRAPLLLGLRHMQIGEDFHAGDGLWLESVLEYRGERFVPQLTLGPHARLSDSVHIACLREITVGAHLLCGSGVLITDHAHGRYAGEDASDPAVPPALRPLNSTAAVRIGSNVWLGDRVAVLPGAEIGDGAVLAVNSVVNGPIPPGTLAAGAPARAIRRWSQAAGRWVRPEDTPAPGASGIELVD